jgi:hypothetical protein
MTWQERILDDGTDRSRWEKARWPVIGASDAKSLSKIDSVEKYLAAKLKAKSFFGNGFTESGHRWEPMMLAWSGIPQNLALIHSPRETGFAATPDGIKELRGGAVLMAECKAKHGVVVDGPNLGEWRQLAWQFLCVPEAEAIVFIWAEIVDGEMRTLEPKSLTVGRDDPKILEVTDQILPIATDLLGRLRAALEFERQLAS